MWKSIRYLNSDTFNVSLGRILHRYAQERNIVFRKITGRNNLPYNSTMRMLNGNLPFSMHTFYTLCGCMGLDAEIVLQEAIDESKKTCSECEQYYCASVKHTGGDRLV